MIPPPAPTPRRADAKRRCYAGAPGTGRCGVAAPPGFTLLEMVIAMAILGMLAAIGGLLVSNGVTAYGATSNAIATQAKQRYALERMVRELRQVRFNGGQYDFTTMAATLVSFTKGDAQQVTLGLTGSDLYIAYTGVAGGANYTLADNVTGLAFSYFQNDGVSVSATPVDVAFVEISLGMSYGSASVSVRTRVAMRPGA